MKCRDGSGFDSTAHICCGCRDSVEASVTSFNVPGPGTRRLGHVLQLSENIKIAGGNDAATIELPYLTQQTLFRIGECQGAASVGAMIEHQQIGFDALGERGEFPGRGMMGSTITLSFSGDLLIGRLRIRLVNQYIAAGAMLDKAWRRRRIA